MYGSVLRHETGVRRASVAVMSISLGVFAFFALAVSGSLGTVLDEMTESMPDVLNAFMGGDSAGGYVVGEVFNLVAPIALVSYGVSIGASALAGEEGDGTMSMLSAQPVTRTALLLAKASGVLLALVVVAFFFWAGTAAGAAFYDSELTIGLLAAAVTHLLFLGLAFAAISFAVGAITGRPGIASGVAAGLAVLSYLVSTMLPLAGLEKWARLSPWYYALESDPLRNGLAFADLGVFVVIIIVAISIGAIVYRSRDLKG